MSAPQVPDPLIEKHKNEATRLNRRRQTASETSKQIVVRREAFFDRLALLNAGALTFSVTLLGSLAAKNPHGKHLLFAAWFLLLIAVGACLLRNLSHQHYQLADALTKMAESEVAYIDIDHEIVSTKNIMYSDSTEAFDRQREITLNRANREVWKKSLDDQQRKSSWHWYIVHGSEWMAGISMILGFALLVIFAVRNL
jgi:hypothetical protein